MLLVAARTATAAPEDRLLIETDDATATIDPYPKIPFASGVAPPAAHLQGHGRSASAELELTRCTHEEPVVSVYADGHAFVSWRRDLIDVELSAAELDGLLQAFATAGLDALPAGEPAHGDAVILGCERYQRVDVDNHRRVLAPVLAAFARIAGCAGLPARIAGCGGEVESH